MNPEVQNGSQNRQILSACRCCLSTNCYKDISTEYYYSGQKEIYEDLLRDTFNVQISSNQSARNLICEDCTRRLRDAHSFKKMVVDSERKLLQLLHDVEIENKIAANEDEIMLQTVKIEEQPSDNIEMDDGGNTDERLRDDDSFDDDEILANLKVELKRGDEEEILEIRKNRVRKARKKSKENDDAEKTKPTSKIQKDWLKIAERRGNGPLLRENSLKLISNSTICVFQWNKSRYRCFCCHEPFSDMHLLREHTNNKHNIEHIEKKIILQQNRLVKVEVSLLYCKLCGVQTENLGSLRNHLTNHGIHFDLKDDLLVPFKIEKNLRCQICAATFAMFRLLNIHMNRHFQKQVCHICGAGFSNLVFLNLHKTRSHRPLKCKECDLNFSNKLDKKEHDVAIHNLKTERKLRFPCPYCSERFFQENFRVEHLVEKHGMSKPEHKCQMCSKVFITRSLCNNHMKNVHLKEKNHECEVCHHFFYTKSDVARHRVTHTGEKKFSCNLCSNLFATKDSLRRHMKRTHAGV